METPCINVCVVNKETGLCEGCGRSVPEIARWSSMSPTERRRIMGELLERQKTARVD